MRTKYGVYVLAGNRVHLLVFIARPHGTQSAISATAADEILK